MLKIYDDIRAKERVIEINILFLNFSINIESIVDIIENIISTIEPMFIFVIAVKSASSFCCTL